MVSPVNSKLILSIETSSTICGVSITQGQNILSIVEEPVNRKHAEILPEFIQSVLEQGGKQVQELSAVAVSIGPGSFTGLRIGLGFAKGLAFAHQLPIIPVPTMEAMAYGIKDMKPLSGIALSHSKKVFYQQFEWQEPFPWCNEKPVIGDFESYLEKLKPARSFQWNCDSLLPESCKLLSAKPSAEHVGLLASHHYDEWVVEKPYGLVPEYIASFEIKPRG